MELKDLEQMTVVQLREEAAKFEDLKGVSGMNKAQLIDTLAEKLNIERPKGEVSGINKAAIKARMKALQAKRKQALADRDYETLADTRMRIKRYKRLIKKHTARTAAGSST